MGSQRVGQNAALAKRNAAARNTFDAALSIAALSVEERATANAKLDGSRVYSEHRQLGTPVTGMRPGSKAAVALEDARREAEEMRKAASMGGFWWRCGSRPHIL